MLKAANLFLAIALAFAALVIATDGRGAEYVRETRYHTVTAGQTVWGIATLYLPEQDKTRDLNEFYYKIGRANGLKHYHIEPGDILAIPLEKAVKM